MNKKYWKLFVDDARPIPHGWLGARTVSEAIAILAHLWVSEVSVDHDIVMQPTPADGNYHPLLHETFRGVAYYIAAMSAENRPTKIRVHTANAGAAHKMCEIMGLKFEEAYKLYDPADYADAEVL